MSHHLDSPLARQDVRLDITDIYAFRGESGTVLVMNVNNSIAGPDAPQGFHPEARYELRVDLDGDAVEDLAYRMSFGPRNGRALTDNAPDVMFSLTTNSASTTGLTVRDATAAPRDRFPYVAAPVRVAEPAGVS